MPIPYTMPTNFFGCYTDPDRKEKDREAGKRQARPTRKGRREGAKFVCYQHGSWGSLSSQSGKIRGNPAKHARAPTSVQTQALSEKPERARLPTGNNLRPLQSPLVGEPGKGLLYKLLLLVGLQVATLRRTIKNNITFHSQVQKPGNPNLPPDCQVEKLTQPEQCLNIL
eukprot:1142736-Pelagomonas_calceolata.AAC.3